MSETEQPDFDLVFPLLRNGDIAELSKIVARYPGFPDGVEPSWGRDWITHAVDCGAVRTVEWMLGRGVGLDRINDEGYFPLLSVMERGEGRHEILQLLLDHGANVDLQSLDHTALHMAAIRDDLVAIKILLEHGADPLIETKTAMYTTPLQEAIWFGNDASARLLVNSDGA